MTVIGTRGSDLALWQSHYVRDHLQGPATLSVFHTLGDRILDRALQQHPEKGLFTTELEVALLEGRIDLAVHSFKDLPTDLPPALAIAAVPVRADAGDVLLVRPEALDWTRALPVQAGARIGTASMRREALVRHVQPDARTTLLRGNVPTRVRKCLEGACDAVILARAGLDRLGLAIAPLVAFDLDPHLWLPAPAQGALAVQIRREDEQMRAQLAPLHDARTARAVTVERELLRRLEGGCHAAFGALAVARVDGRMHLRAGMADAAGAWHAVEAVGTDAEVVAAAFAGLRAAEGRRPTPSDGASWARLAVPWH